MKCNQSNEKKTIYLLKFDYSRNIINKDKKKKLLITEKRGCDVIHSTISVNAFLCLMPYNLLNFAGLSLFSYPESIQIITFAGLCLFYIPCSAKEEFSQLNIYFFKYLESLALLDVILLHPT